MKKCICCKNILSYDNFSKNNNAKDGLRSKCILCINDKKKLILEANLPKCCNRCGVKKELNEFDVASNKLDGRTGLCKECRSSDRKLVKNRKKIYDRIRMRYRRRENINERLIGRLRNCVYLSIKKGYKSKRTLELLGCDIEFLKNYLQSKFVSGMSWENYGRGGWHIDHIIPISRFNLTIKEEQEKCFHYTNLQPLWEFDNLSKGNKILNSKHPPLNAN